MGSKGGSTPQTETVTQNTSSIPAALMPYATSILNQATAEANQPYVPYGGQQLAAQDPNTLASYAAASQLGSVGSGAETAAGNAYTGALGTTTGLQSQTAPGISANLLNQTPYSISPSLQNQQAMGVNAPSLTNYQMTGAAPVSSQSFTDPGVAQSWMDPYETSSLQSQINIANQQFGQQQSQANMQAVQSGAYGGSRAGLVQAQNQANYNNQINAMTAQGLNTAYTTGMQGQQAANSANLLSQEANQQTAQSTGAANLQSLLSTQQLGATTGLAAGQSNASNYLTSLQQQLAAQQAGGNLYNTANAQSLAAQGQAGQFQQTAYQQQLAAAQASGQLGTDQSALGSTQQSMAANGINAEYAAGQSAQNYAQQGLNVAYNNFLNQQQYPEQQTQYLSNILHGLPAATSNTQTTSQYINPVGQLIGAGTGLAGLAGAIGSSGATT